MLEPRKEDGPPNYFGPVSIWHNNRISCWSASQTSSFFEREKITIAGLIQPIKVSQWLPTTPPFKKMLKKQKRRAKNVHSLSHHHCIKCLISVLGRALFFYQDFHFDFLLQYSLSYCWEDRPVSKEKPRSIRCFFFIFVFFLTFGGWNFNHVAQKILIKRAFLRIFFFWDQLNFSLSGVFKRRAI